MQVKKDEMKKDNCFRCFCLVLCFTSQSTAIVMAGRSVHITTPLPERLAIISPVTDELAKGRRMGIEITLNNTYKCAL